jgi:autotransporter-associated beta strand protein
VALSNAGSIRGNVALGDFANSVSLIAGGAINGYLNGGSVTQATLILNGTGTGVLSQAVTGAILNFVSLTKKGTGTWILDENLAYAGGTTITNGALELGNSGTTGSIAGNVANNGTLIFNRADAVTFADVVSGTGILAKQGVGTLTLTGSNTYSGGTTIGGGTLQIGAGGTAGSIVGNVADNGILAFDRSDAVVFSGLIAGTGTVQDLGAGTLTFAGTNTYSGGTSVNNGTVIVAATDALGSGTVTVNDPTELQINPGVTITNPVAINDGGSLSNASVIQVSEPQSGAAAAITISGGGSVTNASGAIITGSGSQRGDSCAR